MKICVHPFDNLFLFILIFTVFYVGYVLDIFWPPLLGMKPIWGGLMTFMLEGPTKFAINLRVQNVYVRGPGRCSGVIWLSGESKKVFQVSTHLTWRHVNTRQSYVMETLKYFLVQITCHGSLSWKQRNRVIMQSDHKVGLLTAPFFTYPPFVIHTSHWQRGMTSHSESKYICIIHTKRTKILLLIYCG